jgi:D-aminopeptidase
MKVFISVDMEGVTGVTDPEDVLPDGADYARGRAFMTGDANAAILGAYDGGATEVLVNDSHWTMRNLLLEALDPRARLIKGFQKPGVAKPTPRTTEYRVTSPSEAMRVIVTQLLLALQVGQQKIYS